MFHRQIPIGSIKKIHFELSKDHIGLTDTQIRTLVARLPNVYEFESRKYFMRPVDYSWMDRKINPMALDN
jgi:alanine-alpha-ketoisovalerate/valine-pyruvate aminotransferase